MSLIIFIAARVHKLLICVQLALVFSAVPFSLQSWICLRCNSLHFLLSNSVTCLPVHFCSLLRSLRMTALSSSAQTTPHNLTYRLAKGAVHLIIQLLIKMLHILSTSIDPGVTPIRTGPQPSKPGSLSWFSTHIAGHLLIPCHFQFGYVEDCQKPCKVKINSIHSFRLINESSQLVIEGSQVAQACFDLGKSILAVTSHLLGLHILGNSFQWIDQECWC